MTLKTSSCAFIVSALVILTFAPLVTGQASGSPECAGLYGFMQVDIGNCVNGCAADGLDFKSKPVESVTKLMAKAKKKPYAQYMQCKLDAARKDPGDPEKVPQHNTLFIGDSNIDYWITSGQIAPGSTNVGVAGATCADVATWTRTALEATQPTTVVLHCGENDMMLIPATPQQAYENLKKVVDQILAWPGVQTVVYFSAMHEAGTKAEGRHHHSEFNKIVEHDVKWQKDTRFHNINAQKKLALVPEGCQGDACNPADLYWASDKLHMTQKGYAHWEKWMQAALATTSTQTDSGNFVEDVEQVVDEN
jgi:lysophospholipase L1-like esterase